MSVSTSTSRSCFPCTLCCSAPAIGPLGKPARVACSHLSAGGCAVYHERQDAKFADCVSFQCFWLRGEFEESDRPDLLGVFFMAKPDADKPERERIFVVESSPGVALVSERVMQLVQGFLDRGLTVAITNPEEVIAMVPGGRAWRYAIDVADPMHSRIDSASAPVAITVRGKGLVGNE